MIGAQKRLHVSFVWPLEDFDLCSCVFNLFCCRCVCVLGFCNTWFSCCCEIKTLFVQLCGMLKGINSKQTSGFWVFLFSSPFPGSREGMLWGMQSWGRMEWVDLASLNAKGILGSSMAPAVCCYKVLVFKCLLYWCGVGFFAFFFPLNWAVLWVQDVHCTVSVTCCCRKHAKDPGIRFSIALAKLALGRCALCCGFANFGWFWRCFCVPCCRPEICVTLCKQSSNPMCEGRGGTWVSASQHSAAGKCSLAPGVTGKRLGSIWFLLVLL